MTKRRLKFFILLFVFNINDVYATSYHIYKGYMTVGQFKQLSHDSKNAYIAGLIDGYLSSALMDEIRKEQTNSIFLCRKNIKVIELTKYITDYLSKGYWPDDETMQRAILNFKSFCREK